VTRNSGDDGDLDARLRDLWRRRAYLSEPEWAELFGIVVKVLRGRHRNLLAQLPNAPDDYLLDFFDDKVFSLSNPSGEIDHRGALTWFYRKYLLSCLKDPDVRDRVHPREGEADEDEGPTPLEKALDGKALENAKSDEPVDVRHLVDWVSHEVVGLIPGSGAAINTSAVQDLISQFLGVDLALVAGSAIDFLHARNDWVNLADDAWWIQLYLRCHYCPDAPGGMALDTLRRAWSIPSHHYKAVKLGITVPKQQDAAFAAFRDSLRGQWLTRLGVPVDLEHRLEMSLALKVLCLVALSMRVPCEKPRRSGAGLARP